MRIRRAARRLGQVAWFSFLLDVRQRSRRLALGLWAGIAGVAFTIAAVVLVARGLGAGLAELFGDSVWAGNLAAGVLLFVVLGAVTGIGIWRSDRRHYRRTETALRDSAPER